MKTNVNALIGELPTRCRIVAVAALALLAFACDGKSADPTNITTEFDIVVKADLDTVKQMLKEHPNLLSITDEHGVSLLEYVSGSSRKDIVELLVVANHADVNTKDNAKNTPLHHAALSGQVEVAKFLLDHHAEVNGKDDMGWTPPILFGTAFAQLVL